MSTSVGLLTGVVIGAPFLALMAGLWFNQQAQLLTQTRDMHVRLTEQASEKRATLKPSPQAKLDYVANLKSQESADHLLDLLRRASEANGVSLQTLTVATRPATTSTLARHSVSVGMRGRYTPVKLVLSDVTERLPGQLVLQGLSIRRATTGAAEVDATVELALLAKPAGVTTP